MYVSLRIYPNTSTLSQHSIRISPSFYLIHIRLLGLCLSRAPSRQSKTYPQHAKVICQSLKSIPKIEGNHPPSTPKFPFKYDSNKLIVFKFFDLSVVVQ